MTTTTNSAKPLLACLKIIFGRYRHIATMVLGTSLLYLSGISASALPVYSRQYNVGCQMCHTVAPRLNKFGNAFHANFFNWPTRTGKPKRDPTEYLPVTTLTTFSYQNDITGKPDTGQRCACRRWFLRSLFPPMGLFHAGCDGLPSWQ